MFSRSDTPDDAHDEASDKQRNPLVLAGLAGLLALVGAFLLVWYLRGDTADVADPVTAEATRDVLVVTQTIDAGTTTQDILAAPNQYLTVKLIPEDLVLDTAITSIQELQDLGNLTLAADATPGEQLLLGRFIDRSSFDNESFTARSAPVVVPEGHHQVVLTLSAGRALGGLIRAGEKVSVVGGFRVAPIDGDPFEVSVVVLPAVEVIQVRASAEVAGQVAASADDVGVATVGSFAITLAVEPDELTQLTYAIEYGSIILAAAIEGADRDDIRPASTIDTVMAGAELVSDDLSDLLGVQVRLETEADQTDASGDATTEPDPEATGDTAPASDDAES